MRLRLIFFILPAIAILAPVNVAFGTDCSRATVMSPAPFRGNDGEMFKLDDGTVWQVKYDRFYLYEYYPTVLICVSRNEMVIRKRTLNIERVRALPAVTAGLAGDKPPYIESRIDGRFEGWSGETIFKLENGEIWQQASYASLHTSKYKPKVLIVRIAAGYEMQVEGTASRVRVQKLQ